MGSKYYSNTRSEMLEFIPNDCVRLLDVGCSSGGFGRVLKERRQVEVWGVEPFAEAAQEAEKHLDKVIRSFFDDAADLPKAYFDVITFNDSLEHFPDEYAPLKLAQTLLKPDGVIVTSIPNFRYLENLKHIILEKDFKYTDAGILDRTHLRFFTLKSMRRLFEDIGMDVVSIQGINPHWWCGWKIFLLRMLFGTHIEDMKYLQYVFVVKFKANNSN